MTTIELDHNEPIAITVPGPGWARANAICIDTSTEMASIAFVESGAVVAEQQWRAGLSHTQQLASRLQGLARDAGFATTSAHFICVCVGPGSFNGIRTGMATAIGLAYGLAVPIHGCSALDLLAFPHADRAPSQRAVVPAGRGDYYSALYGTRGGRWRRMSPYTIAPLATLALETPAKCLWCGIQGDDEQEALTKLLGGARRVVPPSHGVRRAVFMVPLALAAVAGGSDGTIEALQPMYMRRPAITQPRSALSVAGKG